MTSIFILYNSPDKFHDLLSVLRDIEETEVVGDSDDSMAAHSAISDKSPSLVLVEIGNGKDDNIALIERFRNSPQQTSFCAYGENLDSDTVIRATHAGAKFFLKEPFDLHEIKNLIKRNKSDTRLANDKQDGEGKIFTVFSNKGGLGKSTVAVNLAVSLSLKCRKSVALIDLDLQFGDISIFLDLHPAFTISDLSSRIRELDYELIESSMVKHETGVQCLTEPRMAEESDMITPDHVSKILEMIRKSFDYVVIDTTHSFDDVIIESLEMSDSILLISVLDLPTIRNTQRCLEIFRRLNFKDDKIKLVINRFMSEEEVDPNRFEAALKFPIYWKIPNDYSTVINAINGGVPIQRLAPSSAITRNFDELAMRLTGAGDQNRSNHRSGKLARKVFSMMKRSRS